MDRDRNPKSDGNKSSDSSKDSNRRDDHKKDRPSKPSDNPYKRNDRDRGRSSDKPYSRDDRPKNRSSKPSDNPYKRNDRDRDRSSDKPYGRDDRPKYRSSKPSDSPYKRDDRDRGRSSDKPYGRDDRPKNRSSKPSDSPYKRDDRDGGRSSDKPFSRNDRPKDRTGKPSFGSSRKPGNRFDRPDRSSGPRREESRREFKPVRRRVIPNANLPKCLKQIAESPLTVTSESVKNVLDELQFQTSNEQFSSLLDYLLLVKTLNEDINLVSRVDVDSVLLRSLWESLIPALKQDWRRGPNIMDLGTGGGFPGIPLSIALTDSNFTLIDSRRAKILALKQAQKDLNLSNVEVIHERAEVYSSHTETLYDSITVRAVGIMKEVLTWSEPLLKSGGTLLAWKGPEGIKELEFLNKDRWNLIDTLKVLPHRSVYILEHTK